VDRGQSEIHERTSGACVSACAFAYLGGVDRTFDEKGGNRLGIHHFYDRAALLDPSAKVFTAIDYSAQQLLSALVVDYVIRMGIDSRLVLIAANTPPTDMHYLSQQEADELKVTWNPNKFDPWAIEIRNRGVVAFSKTSDRTKTVTLFCRMTDGVPRALVTMPVIDDTLNTTALFSRNPKVVAFGVPATNDRMRVTTKNNMVLWEINLRGINSNNVGSRIGLDDGDRVQLSVFDIPFMEMSSIDLTEAAHIAFQNCI